MLNDCNNWLISKIYKRIRGPFSVCFVAFKAINDLKYRETMGEGKIKKIVFFLVKSEGKCNRY